MNEPKTSSEVMETLTPHEAATLRKRFGIAEKINSDTGVSFPPNGSGNGGSGGTSAPATPPE